jgi:hypothetical protein
MEAWSMLIEGHAVFCSERAAAELGLQAAIEPLRSVFAGSHDATTLVKSRLEARRARGRHRLVYSESALFLAHQHELGGESRKE